VTDTVLQDALGRSTQVAVDTRRVWADTPGLIDPANLGPAMPSVSGICRASRLTTTLCVLPLGLVVWLAARVGTTHAASPPASSSAEVWAAEMAFREAVQLWADERFEALWARGLWASRYRISREVFVGGMRHQMIKPTCCWGQVRAVRIHPQATDEALVEAQVGVEVKTLSTTVRRRMIVYLR
jgi:hypothetical protein